MDSEGSKWSPPPGPCSVCRARRLQRVSSNVSSASETDVSAASTAASLVQQPQVAKRGAGRKYPSTNSAQSKGVTLRRSPRLASQKKKLKKPDAERDAEGGAKQWRGRVVSRKRKVSTRSPKKYSRPARTSRRNPDYKTRSKRRRK